MLIQGSRAAMPMPRQSKTQPGWWLRGLLARAHANTAVVALAAKRPTARDAASPVLSSYSVTRRRDADLDLYVEAADALGFLGRLLSRVSLLTLLPGAIEKRPVKQ